MSATLTSKDLDLLVEWRNYFVDQGEANWTPMMSLLEPQGCMLQQLCDMVGNRDRNILALMGKPDTGPLVRAMTLYCGMYVGVWNDLPDRTWQDCVDLFDEAIEFYSKESDDHILGQERLPEYV